MAYRTSDMILIGWSALCLGVVIGSGFMRWFLLA